jgi:hypothetical protein
MSVFEDEIMMKSFNPRNLFYYIASTAYIPQLFSWRGEEFNHE